MKKIEFRVWHNSQMISPDYVDRDGYAWWKENSIPTATNKNITKCIGIKARGRKIWEGDILQLFTTIGIDRGLCVVKEPDWYEDSEGYRHFGYHFAGYLPKYAKRIGNVFENPELLEKA